MHSELTDPDFIGKKIRLLEMPNDPAPIPEGTCGIITKVSKFADAFLRKLTYVVEVDWEIDRGLNLCVPPDIFEVVQDD